MPSYGLWQWIRASGHGAETGFWIGDIREIKSGRIACPRSLPSIHNRSLEPTNLHRASPYAVTSVTMGLSPQITNLIIILGMMQVAKKIPFEDESVLNLCRAGYIASNLIILSIYLYIQNTINKKKDLTTLKYVEPAPMGSSEEGKLVTTTVQAYDLAQLKNLMRSQMMGVLMMGVMHLYFKYTNPLLIQSIIPLKGALEANLTKIHVWGQPASGDLKRPFKQAAGFMSGLQNGSAQSDKKAVESAERAGRGGAKEE
ncbi:phosphate transporter (Pho88) [Podospora pseudopauciseta]|nr:phosphate transporter (Pho88) [Podospora pseudopauciseta]KAK4670780.1 phosphate transporter (Pho88) [Podospora pseudoanserina]